jgi:signal transduction histidine kinase
VTDSGDALRFEIRDDGAGFDTSTGVGEGHGFVNMADRLGAFGGRVDVTSAPMKGTIVVGFIPLVSAQG